MVKNIVI